MYQNIKSISVPCLWNFKATPFFNKNQLTFLEHLAYAIFNISIMRKTIAPLGVRYKNIGNCLSQLEIKMAEKIILYKFIQNMVKFIELNPEWVLTELPLSHYVDDSGVVSIDTDRATDASWIKLALNTLGIPYEENEYGEGDSTFIDIEFNINDIKENCPALYKRMKEMDAKNKIYRGLNIN